MHPLLKKSWIRPCVSSYVSRLAVCFGLEKVPRRSRDGSHVFLPSGPRVKTPAGLKLTGDLRDENTGHLERVEREATGRRDSLGTRFIYSLMFLDDNNLRSCSP